MTALEAMAAKVPVIASAVGGNVEIFSNPETGLLFESDNARELARCLRTVAGDPEKRRSMAAAAFDAVNRKYSFDTMLSRYSEFYCRFARGEGR